MPRAGFEPATCPLGGDRAIQLCHRGEWVYVNSYIINQTVAMLIEISTDKLEWLDKTLNLISSVAIGIIANAAHLV